MYLITFLALLRQCESFVINNGRTSGLLSALLPKKSLQIPKGSSESVYRRQTDNKMAKWKVQRDKQRSTKHTHKTKDRVTRTPLKTRGELMCSGSVSRSCSTSGTRCVNLVTNPVIRKGSGSVYDKWNISVVSCDTDIP